MRRTITTLLLASAFLVSCSNEPSSTGASQATSGGQASSSGSASPVSTLAVPPLEEGFDSSKEENYRVAAVNVYIRMKNALTVVLAELQKNDYANPEWGGMVAEKASALTSLYEEFEALNPPAEYVEKDKALTANMKVISDLSSDLLAAVDAMDLDAAWEVVHGLQEEGNRLTENGRFEESGTAPAVTTTAP